MMSTYPTLFEASSIRMSEWDSLSNTDLSYYGNELGGECGEVLELGEWLLTGRPASQADFADELGDVVICVTNIAIHAGLPAPDTRGLLRASKLVAFVALGAATGRAQNTIKKLERERLGMPGSRATKAQLSEQLNDIIAAANTIAIDLDINLDRAVAVKFNKTTEKVGLTTFMAVPE